VLDQGHLYVDGLLRRGSTSETQGAHIPATPHGGYKASALGKHMSPSSFDEYTRATHISFDVIGDVGTEWHRTIVGDR
jgi:acyl-CoA reductase-like NAD-dependent aldehyde dehydrogenase